MKTCPRCHAGMLFEPFVDPRGSGDAWICIQCGEREETYLDLNNGAMTDEQVIELMQPSKSGRPRSRQVSGERAN